MEDLCDETVHDGILLGILQTDCGAVREGCCVVWLLNFRIFKGPFDPEEVLQRVCGMSRVRRSGQSSSVEGAPSQECIDGFTRNWETRVFWFNGEFLRLGTRGKCTALAARYAIANKAAVSTEERAHTSQHTHSSSSDGFEESLTGRHRADRHRLISEPCSCHEPR